jgi:hypothetical protein
MLFGVMLFLGASSTSSQEKKPTTTLEDDWKVLCRFQWVNSDPKEAWAQLDEGWKDSYTRKGSKGWSRIELSFKDGRPNKKEHRMSGSWHYLDGKGKEQTKPVLSGIIFGGLGEEKRDRFLLMGKAKIRYVLKDGVLTLNGVYQSTENSAPRIFTGTYKGVEQKDNK